MYFLTPFTHFLHLSVPNHQSVLYEFSFSFFKDLTYKWDHMVFVFVWLLSLSRNIHSCHCKWQDFFNDWIIFHYIYKASLVAQMVKNLPAMQETQVQPLGPEEPLEEGMATHSSILAWRIPWAEEPSGLQSLGSQRVEHDWVTKHTHTHTHIPGCGENSVSWSVKSTKHAIGTQKILLLSLKQKQMIVTLHS